MALAVAAGLRRQGRRAATRSRPGRRPEGFAARLAAAEPYLVYRAKVEIERAEDRETAFRSIKALLDEAPDSPQRHEAWRYANDRIGMTVQLRAASLARAAGLRPRSACSTRARSSSGASSQAPSPIRPCGPCSPSSPPITSTTRSTVRSATTSSMVRRSTRTASACSPSSTPYAAAEGIGEATGDELLLRLRERELRRELRAAPLERAAELSEALRRLRERAARSVCVAAATLPPPTIPGSSIGRAFGC